MVYKAEDFRSAYKLFAIEWAERFLREAFEEAKVNPIAEQFSKKIYTHKKIVDEIYENLNRLTTRDVTIEQDWKDQSDGDICATFKVIW